MARNYSRTLRKMCKHQDRVKESHNCFNCGLGRPYVQFHVSIQKRTGYVSVAKFCTMCTARKDRGEEMRTERAPRLSGSVSRRVKEYFEEKYMLFKIMRGNKQIGSVYAPNIKTALKRAKVMHGTDVDVEEK